MTISKHLSPAQVGNTLGLHQQTVLSLIRRGELAAYRVGSKTIRVRPEDLEDYLKRSKIVSQSAAR